MLHLFKNILCCIALLSSSFSGWCQMVNNGTVTGVYETQVHLTALRRVKFEARNISPGCEPVIHLFTLAGREVMAALATKLEYLPVVTGSFILLVRANNAKGSADIYQDGSKIGTGVAVGGWNIWMTNLRAKETLQTIRVPRGPAGKFRMYILKADGFGVAQRIIPGSTDFVNFYQLPVAMGNRMVIFGTDSSEGPGRLIRNDFAIVGHDPDIDGLGTELESELGTCSSLSGFAKGFSCELATDPKDTDGDGISDGWEVLGRRDVAPIQRLPEWGADPRHKDLFIEFDFMHRTFTEDTAMKVEKMSVAVAKHFAAVYGDAFTTDPVVRLYHASVLRNPDALPGISVHFDIGVTPQTPEDATIYGDWGGFSIVNAIKSNGTLCTGVGTCIGQSANKAWIQNMRSARRGIFRYGLGYTTGGGSNDIGFGCDCNFHDLTNPPHEWGHTMGLGHSGPKNVTGNIDVNCKPNYPSIMNYAYIYEPNMGFADGNGFPALNNTALTEWNAVNPHNTAYLDLLERVFGYWIDRVHGHVDWNRNGIFEPAGVNVRAYVNSKPATGCEYTKYNQLDVGNAETTTTPVLARLGDRLYIFYNQDGQLKYRSSKDDFDCPAPAVAGCGNDGFGTEKSAGVSGIIGLDAVNTGNAIKVIAVKFNGQMTEVRLSLVGQNEIWSAPAQVPGSSAGDPSVTFNLVTGTWLVYKGTDLNIHFNRYTNGHWQNDQVATDAAGNPIRSTLDFAFPSSIQAVLPWKPNAKGLYGLFPDMSATLNLWWYNSITGHWERTDLLEGGSTQPVHSKPAMAFVPYKAAQQDQGRLYIVYGQKPHSGVSYDGICFMRTSYVSVHTNPDGTVTRDEKIGLETYFHNEWYPTYGISLFYEAGKDLNLKAALTTGIPAEQFRIHFRPKADGVEDFGYTNYNDWDVLRVGLCKQVVNPGGVVAHPISCPLQ